MGTKLVNKICKRTLTPRVSNLATGSYTLLRKEEEDEDEEEELFQFGDGPRAERVMVRSHMRKYEDEYKRDKNPSCAKKRSICVPHTTWYLKMKKCHLCHFGVGVHIYTDASKLTNAAMLVFVHMAECTFIWEEYMETAPIHCRV